MQGLKEVSVLWISRFHPRCTNRKCHVLAGDEVHLAAGNGENQARGQPFEMAPAAKIPSHTERKLLVE
jgi:hypothetical protein